MRRRPRACKPAAGVSLFPFLAVLICTMGGLIVLLVMVVQQARRSADQAAENAAQQQLDAQQTGELQEALEDRQWQRDVLVTQQQEKTAELADRRRELSHLEEHLRQLQKQWRGLIAAAEQLERGDSGRDDQRRRAEQKLQQTALEIQAVQRDLEQAKAKVARKQGSFAILPYDGPNGTRRRPIYLECTAEGVIIQPEGVTVTLADLTGPQGPGNPLAAVLRQVRDYLMQTVRGAEGEPYPLLLVRPDGVESYNLARQAMASWDDEFGYELIRSDLKVEFPKVNPALARSLHKTIAAARDRQAKLIQAMPNRFRRGGGIGVGRGGGGGMVASPRGGFVPAGGSRGGRGVGGGRGGTGRLGSGTSGAGRFGGTSSSRTSAGRSPNGSSSRGTGTSATAGNSTSGRSDGNSSSSGSSAGRSNDARTAQRGGASGASQSGGANQQASSGSGGPGGSSGTPGGRRGTTSADGQPNAGAFGGAGSGGSGGGGAGGGSCPCVADQRGDNWALPGRGAGATGVTRPIRIACLHDRLVILPEVGQSRPPRVVPLPGPTPRHIDDFVEAVWKHVDGWGIALAGGYWKPVLKVEIAPGGQQRFADLQQLLRDSGLRVTQRNQPTGERP